MFLTYEQAYSELIFLKLVYSEIQLYQKPFHITANKDLKEAVNIKEIVRFISIQWNYDLQIMNELINRIVLTLDMNFIRFLQLEISSVIKGCSKEIENIKNNELLLLY